MELEEDSWWESTKAKKKILNGNLVRKGLNMFVETDMESDISTGAEVFFAISYKTMQRQDRRNTGQDKLTETCNGSDIVRRSSAGSTVYLFKTNG